MSCGSPNWLAVASTWPSSIVRLKVGPPLGLSSATEFAKLAVTHVPAPGEVLFAYTDGLIDGTRARENFRGRLAEVGKAGRRDLEALSGIVWAKPPTEFRPLADDATVVFLRYE